MTKIRNRIRLFTRDKNKMDEIHSFLSEFSFENIAPLPNVEDNTKTTAYYDDIILEKWGTRNEPTNVGWVNDIDFIFDTDNTPATPIFINIAKRFSDVRFEFKFSSEIIGKHSGILNAIGGKITSVIKHPSFSRAAYETAFELRPYAQYEHKLNPITNNYEYNIEDIVECINENGVYSEDKLTELILLDQDSVEVL